MTSHQSRSLSASLLLGLISTGCATPPAQEPRYSEVEIPFELSANGQILKCGETVSDIGATGAKLSLQDARIYVSNIRLLSPDGRETPLELVQDGMWQRAGLALLDFEDASGACNGNPVTNTSVRGKVPDRKYSGLAFDIGVPESMNHQDPTLAAPPLNQSALSWPWRFGYKHTTIDLETSSAAGSAEASGFSIHLGATHCQDGPIMTAPSTACERQNRPAIELMDFDPSTQSVVIDLGALLADTDITVNDPGTASGCMSGADDKDCAGIFRHAGLKDEPQSFVHGELR